MKNIMLSLAPCALHDIEQNFPLLIHLEFYKEEISKICEIEKTKKRFSIKSKIFIKLKEETKKNRYSPEIVIDPFLHWRDPTEQTTYLEGLEKILELKI